MKYLFSLFLLLVVSTNVFASPVRQGETQLNAGIGLSDWGIPIYVGLDFPVHPDVTLGAELNFRTKNYTYNYTWIGVFGNVNYHFNRAFRINPQFDLYGGLTIGYYFVSSDAPSNFNYSYNSDLGWGLQIGGRYYFSNNFGLNFEAGSGTVSGAKLGISYQF